jgi:predicted transcriptional regulator
MIQIKNQKFRFKYFSRKRLMIMVENISFKISDHSIKIKPLVKQINLHYF